jgi:hypothetical protein
MKPIITVENVDYQGDQIEIGTLVVYKARIGMVRSLHDNNTNASVFEFKAHEITLWPFNECKIFKGKLIMEQ